MTQRTLAPSLPLSCLVLFVFGLASCRIRVVVRDSKVEIYGVECVAWRPQSEPRRPRSALDIGEKEKGAESVGSAGWLAGCSTKFGSMGIRLGNHIFHSISTYLASLEERRGLETLKFSTLDINVVLWYEPLDVL